MRHGAIACQRLAGLWSGFGTNKTVRRLQQSWRQRAGGPYRVGAGRGVAAVSRSVAVLHGPSLCTNLWGDIGASGVFARLARSRPTQALGVVTGEGIDAHAPRHPRPRNGPLCPGSNTRDRDGTTMDYNDRGTMIRGYNDYAALDRGVRLDRPARINAWNLRYMKWLDEPRVWKGSDRAYDETITLRPIEAPRPSRLSRRGDARRMASTNSESRPV